MRQVAVTTTYLEMTSPEQLRRAPATVAGWAVRQAEIPSPELNRFLYAAVGGNWYWTDRLPWTYEQWLGYLDRPTLQTWVGYLQGTPVGYFELDKGTDDSVELAYFGLLPQFIGRGLGGPLLSAAIERAWAFGAGRVWVHTCTLDAPAALNNYQARGFRIYRQRTDTRALPETLPGPW